MTLTISCPYLLMVAGYPRGKRSAMHANLFVGAWTAPNADSQVHRRIVTALHWWTVIFLCSWTPLAIIVSYVFSDISLEISSPPWVTMALLQGLMLLAAASFSADVLIRVRAPTFSVLYLRKFHAEEREAFPINPFDENSGLGPGSSRRDQRFRLAAMLEGVGLCGVRVIALRDARTPGSGHVLFYLLPIYLLLMLFAPAMMLLFICWGLSVSLAAAAGLGQEHWGALLAAVMLGFIGAIAIWPKAQIWLRTSMEKHAEAARGILVRGFRPRDLNELNRLVASARSVGPVAVRSSDRNWETFVERLLCCTDFTLFDVRASSANCAKELELIQRLQLQDRVFWLVAAPSDIVQESETYRVGPTAFPGQPNFVIVPQNEPRPALWHPINLAHVKFLSGLLVAIDLVRRDARALH